MEVASGRNLEKLARVRRLLVFAAIRQRSSGKKRLRASATLHGAFPRLGATFGRHGNAERTVIGGGGAFWLRFLQRGVVLTRLGLERSLLQIAVHHQNGRVYHIFDGVGQNTSRTVTIVQVMVMMKMVARFSAQKTRLVVARLGVVQNTKKSINLHSFLDKM